MDLKTGAGEVPAWAALQVAAYAMASEAIGTNWSESLEPARFSAVLHVPMGSDWWELQWVDVPAGWAAFEERLLGVSRHRLDRRRLFRPEHRVLAEMRRVREGDIASRFGTGRPLLGSGHQQRSHALRLAAEAQWPEAARVVDEIAEDDTWRATVIDLARMAAAGSELRFAAGLLVSRLDRRDRALEIARLVDGDRAADIRAPGSDPLTAELLRLVEAEGDLGYLIDLGEYTSALMIAARLSDAGPRTRWLGEVLVASSCQAAQPRIADALSLAVEIPNDGDRALALVRLLQEVPRESPPESLAHLVDAVIDATPSLETAERVEAFTALLAVADEELVVRLFARGVAEAACIAGHRERESALIALTNAAADSRLNLERLADSAARATEGRPREQRIAVWSTLLGRDFEGMVDAAQSSALDEEEFADSLLSMVGDVWAFDPESALARLSPRHMTAEQILRIHPDPDGSESAELQWLEESRDHVVTVLANSDLSRLTDEVAIWAAAIAFDMSDDWRPGFLGAVVGLLPSASARRAVVDSVVDEVIGCGDAVEHWDGLLRFVEALPFELKRRPY